MYLFFHPFLYATCPHIPSEILFRKQDSLVVKEGSDGDKTLLCPPIQCSVNHTVDKKICMPFRLIGIKGDTHVTWLTHVKYSLHIYLQLSSLLYSPKCHRTRMTVSSSLLTLTKFSQNSFFHSPHEPGLGRHNFLRCNVWLFLAFWPTGLL